MIHREGSTVVYKSCGDCTEGVHPWRIHRIGPPLYHKGSAESFKGWQPLKDSMHEVYTSPQELQ